LREKGLFSLSFFEKYFPFYEKSIMAQSIPGNAASLFIYL